MKNADQALPASNQPEDFWLGIEQFNHREYYACHDTLEAIWMDAQSINRGFYQGILQIAVGLYHLTNLNWQGAAILLGEGIHRLDAYADSYGGIDVAALVSQAVDWLNALQELGPNQVQPLASILSAQPQKAGAQVAPLIQALTVPKIQLG